jgi:hypothetical protein
MAVQARRDNTNFPFILNGMALTKGDQTVVQDAGRATAMALYTVMTYDPATAKWNSWTDETATDGTQYPKGILLRALTAAEIVAGDVSDVPIMVGGLGVLVNEDLLVIENSLTLATVINVPTNLNSTAEGELNKIGIWPEIAASMDLLENT